MTATRHRVGGYVSIVAGAVLLLFGGATAWGQEAVPDPGSTVCAATGCEPASDSSHEEAAAHESEDADPTHKHAAEQPESVPATQQHRAAAPAPRGQAARSAQTKSASVDIGDNFFDPKDLTISVGTTVTWTNKGERPHTSTADDGSWDSGGDPSDYILPGQSFSHTFTTAGEFPYYCRLHGGPGGSGQAGVITVTADNGTGGQQPTTTPGATPDDATDDADGASTRTTRPRSADTSTGELAKTGPEHLILAPAGLALIATGGALLFAARRRAACE